MKSGFYLSFPSEFIKDEDLSTGLQHCFNSSLGTIESIEFKIRKFWDRIITHERIKAEIIHYALYWCGFKTEYFYYFNDLLKPNLDLIVDRTRCWTYSYKMTNLQYAVHRIGNNDHDDREIKAAALLLAAGARPDLSGPAKPKHVAENIKEKMPEFKAILADLNNLPRAEYITKYGIEDKRAPTKDIKGFEFDKLLPEIKMVVLNMAIYQYDWLRLVCKDWRDITMKILRQNIPRVPKEFIGEHEVKNKEGELDLKTTVQIFETDEISLRFKYEERMNYMPRQNFSMEKDWPELPGLAAFTEFMKSYVTNCQYVVSETSISNFGYSSEHSERIFVCKCAGFGVFVIKKTLIEGLRENMF